MAQKQFEKVPIHKYVKDAFVQFSRNGRWGTCGACPRDNNNAAYPEFCQYKDRIDHHLDVDELAHHHKSYLNDIT